MQRSIVQNPWIPEAPLRFEDVKGAGLMNTERNDKRIVLSTGRTGTNYLARIFSALERREISHQGRFSRIMNIAGNMGLCPGFESLSKTFLFHMLNRTDSMKSTVDPLLSIPHILLMDRFQDTKRSKILHIVRDPRDFATSFMNWRRQRLRRLFLHHCVPFWQPNPWCAGDVNFMEYLQMSKFEHFCWIWAYKNRMFEKVGLDCRVEYLRIRMEDLMGSQDSAGRSLHGLASFLDVPAQRLAELMMKSPAMNRSTNRSFPRWRSWTRRQAVILEKHCGPLMEKYGYGAEPEWRKLLSF